MFNIHYKYNIQYIIKAVTRAINAPDKKLINPTKNDKKKKLFDEIVLKRKKKCYLCNKFENCDFNITTTLAYTFQPKYGPVYYIINDTTFTWPDQTHSIKQMSSNVISKKCIIEEQ